jgi:serine phosphatase RsbU (regulator of sigma subunit)
MQRLRKAHLDQQVQKTVIQQLTGQIERAGREQAALLPGGAPRLEGWEFAVTLTPVWQTSGDFYDFVALDDHRLGLLVADVADKGSGAAMYMALACTLLRTYAHEYPDAPELVLEAANNRLLADTASDGFVTVFYGVLDLETGDLTYANAGHNPGFLVCPATGDTQPLVRTGVPLGMIRARHWERATVTLQPNDRLVLYTDGINEAANMASEQFGEERIVRVMQCYHGNHANLIRDALVAAVRTFVGGAVQGDDMTLLVAVRQ